MTLCFHSFSYLPKRNGPSRAGVSGMSTVLFCLITDEKTPSSFNSALDEYVDDLALIDA